MGLKPTTYNKIFGFDENYCLTYEISVKLLKSSKRTPDKRFFIFTEPFFFKERFNLFDFVIFVYLSSI